MDDVYRFLNMLMDTTHGRCVLIAAAVIGIFMLARSERSTVRILCKTSPPSLLIQRHRIARTGPIQMLVKKPERSDTANGMRAVKEFDFGSI